MFLWDFPDSISFEGGDYLCFLVFCSLIFLHSGGPIGSVAGFFAVVDLPNHLFGA